MLLYPSRSAFTKQIAVATCRTLAFMLVQRKPLKHPFLGHMPQTLGPMLPRPLLGFSSLQNMHAYPLLRAAWSSEGYVHFKRNACCKNVKHFRHENAGDKPGSEPRCLANLFSLARCSSHVTSAAVFSELFERFQIGESRQHLPGIWILLC